MLKLRSNTIEDFPFELYAKCQNSSQLEDLAKAHYLTSFNSWMLPQIAHHYGEWKLVYNPATDKIDPKLTARENIQTAWEIGLWKVCTQLKRGSLVKSQINPEFASYSALVPLILMGSKKYKGIPYNSWDIQPDCFLVDKNLCEAMLWQPDDQWCDTDMIPGEPKYGLSDTRLLELREVGLTVKSGPAKGQVLNPTSSWCLKGMQGTEFHKVPKLVGTMLTQIWVAHPSLRTEYMILDPNDWDWMPPPLVSANIFKQESAAKPEPAPEKMPWD